MKVTRKGNRIIEIKLSGCEVETLLIRAIQDHLNEHEIAAHANFNLGLKELVIKVEPRVEVIAEEEVEL